MTNTTLKVSGMHCSSCSMLITMNLEDLDGVERVKCDHATGLTEVTYDHTQVDTDSIVREIVESGYSADVVS